MRNITLEELLEAGCHFGHQINRRNPKADAYIFEARNNVNIINLESTRDGLIAAGEFLKNVAAQGGSLLVVGTKRQAHAIVLEEITRAREAESNDVYYITSRWIGGVLTNYSEVSKNFKRLKELREFLSSKDQSAYTKKERLLMAREKDKLESFYAGVADMKKIPDAIFIIDTHSEHTAVDEAAKMHVKTVGITDTNADPTEVIYSIPSNDDAVGAIRIITNYLMDAWIEGSKKARADREKAEKAEAKQVKTDVKAEVAEGSQGSKQSPVAKVANKKADVKEAQAEVSTAVPKETKRMNTKPAVKDANSK